ncbi:hypothetical protein C8Q80DRAFT_203643 [Daedaleopsis nitida]|nr:hypothetical protein C8Q80DRAFT_203643 [Daedaleopsis nitida]
MGTYRRTLASTFPLTHIWYVSAVQLRETREHVLRLSIYHGQPGSGTEYDGDCGGDGALYSGRKRWLLIQPF